MTFVKGRDNICGYPDGVCRAMDSEGTCEVCEGSGEGDSECGVCEGYGHWWLPGTNYFPRGYDPEDGEIVIEIKLNSREHGECDTCDGSGYVCGACHMGFCRLCMA